MEAEGGVMAFTHTSPCHSGASQSEEPGAHDGVKPSNRMIANARPVVGSGLKPSACPGMTVRFRCELPHAALRFQPIRQLTSTSVASNMNSSVAWNSPVAACGSRTVDCAISPPT